MQTSPTDPGEEGGTLLRFADGRAPLCVVPGAGTALAVSGTEVAIHWLELAGDLTPAQAAAAARLMLADASAEPLAEMHVAAGRAENGLTPVALVPVARMLAWVEGDPDLIVPETLLLLPPAEGLVRRGLDHRGLAAAFAAEPELVALLIGDAPVADIDEDGFEAGLAAALAAPALNLRQGPFARRRQWKIDRGSLQRVAWLVAALAVVSLLAQLAAIARYTSDAQRLEAEAAALGGAGAAAARPGFGVVAPLLFEAVRATPNAELTRLEYRPDGSLGATLSVDSAATLAAFRARAEASGLAVEGGNLTGAGGQPRAELVLRPA